MDKLKEILEKLRGICGLILIIIGVLTGLYVGGYLMFIRGTVQLIQGITPQIIISDIGWGIGKIILSGIIGIISMVVLIAPGIAIFQYDLHRHC